MARVGQSRKRDASEPGIVQALRDLGALVIRISEKGAPDLVVYFRGELFLLECKSAHGRATVAQDAKKAEGWPVATVRDAGDALAAVGVFYSGTYPPLKPARRGQTR